MVAFSDNWQNSKLPQSVRLLKNYFRRIEVLVWTHHHLNKHILLKYSRIVKKVKYYEFTKKYVAQHDLYRKQAEPATNGSSLEYMHGYIKSYSQKFEVTHHTALLVYVSKET